MKASVLISPTKFVQLLRIGNAALLARGGDRDREHRSYYDRKEERRQREREEEEERRSHRDYRTRPVKREPYDDRSSLYEDDRPHRPSRPGSRTGSVSHYGEHDQSYGYRNQWAILQQ